MEIINFILYLLLVVYIYKFHKNASFALYVSSLWLLSAFIGIFYYHSSVYRKGLYDISFFPFFFLWFCFLLSLVPMLSQEKSVVRVIYGNPQIKWLIYIIVSISIIPGIEIIISLLQMAISGRFMLLGAYYDEVVAGDTEQLISISSLSTFLLQFLRNGKVINLILFFYYMQFKKRSKYVACGLLFASFLPALGNITYGNRTELIWFLIYFFCMYFFLKNTYSEMVKSFFKKLSVLILSLFLTILISLSIGRYIVGSYYNASSIDGYLLKYTSESMYNFNNYAFYEEKPLMGYQTANTFLNKIGFSKITKQSELRAHIDSHTKSPSNIFYTFIGDLYKDFGMLGTLIYVSFFAFVFSFFRIKRKMKLQDVAMLGTYVYLIANGLFYYCYKVSYGPLTYCIIFYIVANVMDNSNIKLIEKMRK